MKLLVFAHTPPPHHGQSYMVQLMLEGFGGDQRRRPPTAGAPSPAIRCYHVNARLSAGIQDIGGFQPRKIFLIFKYSLQAVWCRFRYGVKNFYYVPAPGKRAAVYRDWLVLLLCRPFFKRTVLHWHAAGLSAWLDSSASRFTRWLTLRMLGKPELSVVLSEYNRTDAQRFRSQRMATVSNGLADPCPAFHKDLLPRRQARFAARAKLHSGAALVPEELKAAGSDPYLLNVLYVAHCTREKGLFDALDAIAALNQKFTAAHSCARARLMVAGEFIDNVERDEFETRCRAPDLQLSKIPAAIPGAEQVTGSAVQYLGFISGDAKKQAFSQSDCLCFPTYYLAENVPVALIEAMAFGLPIVTTRWRSLPELFPPGYEGLVDIRSPDQLSKAMERVTSTQSGEALRDLFLRNFTLDRHLSRLAEALATLEPSAQD